MKNAIAKALGAAAVSVAGLGLAGHASADVYGVGYVDVDNLTILAGDASSGAPAVPGQYQFATSAQAKLDGGIAFPPSLESCTANWPGTGTCGGPGAGEVLGGPVQNAPGGDGTIRGEGDYTIYGLAGDYSNAESAIIDAQLVGDPDTHIAAISESNLVGDTTAQANTNTSSTTSLDFTFTIGPNGFFDLAFDAIWDNMVAITSPDDGLAQATITAVASLTGTSGTALGTFVQWTIGDSLVCVGAVCAQAVAGDLNSTLSIDALGVDSNAGAGAFSLNVSGLQEGTYSVALNVTTSTLLSRQIPLPGTLLLMGAGLLGAGMFQRKKA